MEAVRGLRKFREHFASHSDKYVLIGGVASLLVSEEHGIDFRATRDLDIVLCLEAVDDSFIETFWKFIRSGGYAQREVGNKPRNYYRFQKPTDQAYPLMLELFSRVPDGIAIEDGMVLTPIPAGEEVSSLSAILMNDDYYAWVLQGKKQLEGITLVGAEHLVPLKATAHLDLSARRSQGEKIDGSDVKKHLRDVVRLTRLLTGQPFSSVPDAVRADIRQFIEVFPTDFDFRPFKTDGLNRKAILDTLWSSYLD